MMKIIAGCSRYYVFIAAKDLSPEISQVIIVPKLVWSSSWDAKLSLIGIRLRFQGEIL
jgi:hypothetical protein